MSTVTDEQIKDSVRGTYGQIARRFVEEQPVRSGGCCGPEQQQPQQQSGCCGPEPQQSQQQSGCCGPSEAEAEAAVAAARFYSDEEIGDLPESVTEASLGCGNPLAIAGLQPGEVVLDLGSGGGIDCFLAAKRVGPTGQVIGLDMTPDMIRLARRNAKKVGATNVDFRYGEMEDMPLADASVDVIISNCVINLSPDKDAVFGEAYRVLKPGGRLSISDMVVDGDLPSTIRNRLDAWAGCIAGALDESVYLDKIRAAGFERVEVASREMAEADEVTEWDEVQVILAGEDGQAVDGDQAKAMLQEAGLSPHELARKVASIKVTAYKPA